MNKNNNIMKGQGEDGKWITVNGTHIFVEEGQSVEDAMNSKFDKQQKLPKESIVNGYVIRRADNSNNYFVYNNKGHFEDDAHKGQGYTSYQEAQKRAIELPKGIAKEDNKETESKVKVTLSDDKRKRYDELSEKVIANRAKIKNASPKEKEKLISENYRLMTEMDSMWDN